MGDQTFMMEITRFSISMTIQDTKKQEDAKVAVQNLPSLNAMILAWHSRIDFKGKTFKLSMNHKLPPLKRQKFLLKEPREIVITAVIKSNLLSYDLASKKLIDNPIPALSVLQKSEMSQAE